MNVTLEVHKDEAADCWVIRSLGFACVSQSSNPWDVVEAWLHVFYGGILVDLEHGQIPKFRKETEPAVPGRHCITIDLAEHAPRWWREALGKLIASWVPL